jgi:hypothetical protein
LKSLCERNHCETNEDKNDGGLNQVIDRWTKGKTIDKNNAKEKYLSDNTSDQEKKGRSF